MNENEKQYKQLLQYRELLEKIKEGDKNGDSTQDFFNDIIDAYNKGILDKADFIRVMRETSNYRATEYKKLIKNKIN